VVEDFVWRDAGRTVVFRGDALADATAILAEHGFEEFELLGTERALAGGRSLAEAARSVHRVPPGQVPELARSLLGDVELSHGMRGKAQHRPLVALGGGRVIDVAKAAASVLGTEVAAIPTTMSGAEMSQSHRLPAGHEERVGARVRPALVIADPVAMTSQPEPQLRASSLNALAHGADSLYTPLANPVSRMTGLRGAGLIAAALARAGGERDASELALGSILCGYAIDSAKFGLHHPICQTLVRVCGTPHAETNAAVLPPAIAFLAPRAPALFAELARSIGTDPAGLESRLRELGGEPPGLGALGGDRARLGEALGTILERPELAAVPGPPISRPELAALVEKAWK
jgi:maleylacetate reductase